MLEIENDGMEGQTDSNSQIQSSVNNITKDTEGKKKVKKKKTASTLVANLIDTQYSVVKKVVRGMLNFKVVREAGMEEWDLYWTDNAVTAEQLGKMKHHQKINHFPGMYTLSRKNYLARNLIKMEKKFPQDYNFFPKTWVLPSELNDLRNFMEAEPNAVVIAKPEASSQGRGIFLTKNFEDFEFGQHYVVQKYLKKPFLIDGLKFDLRVYVLVAGCDPLRVYVYKQGLARFATEPYCYPKKQNLNNLFMHLTNYAINKNSDKFEFNNSSSQMNKGHKRSLTSILAKLEQLGHNRQKIWDSIKNCITKTLISAQPLLAHQYKSSQPNNYANNMCFEILGFDVILDHSLRPQILEVNYTPSFTTDTPLDLQIKKNLIHDSLVLMNMTSKAKNQVINERKREIKERTLTGKNFHHTREAKLGLIERLQRKRNTWQSSHMGNFERAYPVFVRVSSRKQKQSEASNQRISSLSHLEYPQNEQNSCQSTPDLKDEQLLQLDQKYRQFIEHSSQCYQVNTGANIKRNTKIIPTSNSVTNGLTTLHEESRVRGNEDKVSNMAGKMSECQPAKFTNTQNLQKIYKTKFRPMIYKKNTGPILPRPRTDKQLQNQDSQPAGKAQKSSPYSSGVQGLTNTRSKNSVPNYPVSEKRVKHQTVERRAAQMNTRAASSMKKGLSTVYNITFVDRKPNPGGQ